MVAAEVVTPAVPRFTNPTASAVDRADPLRTPHLFRGMKKGRTVTSFPFRVFEWMRLQRVAAQPAA